MISRQRTFENRLESIPGRISLKSFVSNGNHVAQPTSPPKMRLSRTRYAIRRPSPWRLAHLCGTSAAADGGETDQENTSDWMHFARQARRMGAWTPDEFRRPKPTPLPKFYRVASKCVTRHESSPSARLGSSPPSTTAIRPVWEPSRERRDWYGCSIPLLEVTRRRLRSPCASSVRNRQNPPSPCAT